MLHQSAGQHLPCKGRGHRACWHIATIPHLRRPELCEGIPLSGWSIADRSAVSPPGLLQPVVRLANVHRPVASLLFRIALRCANDLPCIFPSLHRVPEELPASIAIFGPRVGFPETCESSLQIGSADLPGTIYRFSYRFSLYIESGKPDTALLRNRTRLRVRQARHGFRLNLTRVQCRRRHQSRVRIPDTALGPEANLVDPRKAHRQRLAEVQSRSRMRKHTVSAAAAASSDRADAPAE